MAMAQCFRPLHSSDPASCCSSSAAALIHSSSRAGFLPTPSSVRIGVRAMGVDTGRIGSRRRKGGSPPRESEAPEVDRRREPFLQVYQRQFREEGHLVLDDMEMLLSKASNPYALTIQIGEEANEYLRNNKKESLIRKPILKVISDRVNEAYGEGLRDSYLDQKEDYSEFEVE